MKTKIVKVESRIDKMGKTIDVAVKALHNKGIIIFPTETSYGLGCDATNEEAIKKIFELKGRDYEKSLPIIVSDARMIKEYANLNPLAEYLIEQYLPGPLTIIVEKNEKISDSLSKNGIAFRIPSREFTRLLVQEAGVPLVSTSANASGKQQPYNISEVIQEFDGKVDVIIDSGNLPPINPSTIIDTRREPPEILREGPLSGKELLKEIAKHKK
ncbi:MAG: L-threonylcarbamoyladenylate synthase [Candidatus Micrarchaeota archaeon]